MTEETDEPYKITISWGTTGMLTPVVFVKVPGQGRALRQRLEMIRDVIAEHRKGHTRTDELSILGGNFEPGVMLVCKGEMFATGRHRKKPAVVSWLVKNLVRLTDLPHSTKIEIIELPRGRR